jgi:hypothetical protein
VPLLKAPARRTCSCTCTCTHPLPQSALHYIALHCIDVCSGAMFMTFIAYHGCQLRRVLTDRGTS